MSRVQKSRTDRRNSWDGLRASRSPLPAEVGMFSSEEISQVPRLHRIDCGRSENESWRISTHGSFGMEKAKWSEIPVRRLADLGKICADSCTLHEERQVKVLINRYSFRLKRFIRRQNLSLVRLGDQNLAESDDGADPVEYDIKETYEHHLHDSYRRHHDIALVELERNVRFTEFIRPACLHQVEHISSVVIAVNGATNHH